MVVAEETVANGDRRRTIPVMGSTRDMIAVQEFKVAQGSFLPEGDVRRGAPVVVLGYKTATELFPGEQAVGGSVRIGDRRARVIGVLDPRGLQVGINLDDIAIIPVATAMQLFNRAGLFRMILQTRAHADLDSVRDKVSAVLQERHDGEIDFTILTQDAVVETLGTVLRVLTMALVAIAAISLSVAGIGIMNVMLVSVSERTSEIGLMRAIGAKRRHILAVFLAEAALLLDRRRHPRHPARRLGRGRGGAPLPDLPRAAAAVGGGGGDHGGDGVRPGVRHAAGAARDPARPDRSAQESVTAG